VLAEEIDVALDELETRLDRLRSLYEQYFLGIEKIEPSVARKDVDRRFWLLRRTQIRNTARRFRLQVLIQRYNTFQQYWARICREIENGTYSRHLIRAQKNLGQEPKTWAAKKRLGYFRKRDEGDNGRESARPSSNEELGALLDGGMDLDAEAARAAAEALQSADARSRETALPSDAPRTGVVASPTAVSAPKARPEPTRRGGLEMLDLDLDDGLPPAMPSARPMPLPRLAREAAPARPQSLPLPRPAIPTTDGALQPRPPVAPEKQSPEPRPPIAPAQTAPQPRPPIAPAQTAPQPRPPIAPAQTAPQPRPPIAAQAAPARVPPPRPVAQTAPEGRPQPVRQPQAGSPAGGISEERLKQIHAELSAAKRQAKQTDAVSLDALGKSLRESATRIQAQHPGRSVDFHVVVKDGKPVVKPIVRK
jgi:hypothetical protein